MAQETGGMEQGAGGAAGPVGTEPVTGAGADEDWARHRREAATARAAMLDRGRLAATRRASDLLVRFAAAARAAGLATEPLRVQGYGGGTARTHTSGWYLRRDRSVGVGTDGSFYVLTARLGLAARLCGVDPVPAEPPLVLGAGGRDGDSVDLATALDRLLPGWDGGG
ncbi:hypothetical protein [Georgenia sp.]